MDVQVIDQQFGQLQSQAQQTVQALQALGGKLQAAAQNGDQQAREWFLDLRELAISFKNEQDQMSNLLQAIHGFVANEAQQQGGYQGSQPQASWGQQPGYGQASQGNYAPQPPPGGFAPQAAPGGFAPQAAQGGFAPQAQGGGGMLGSFLNSGFGRAIEMGAGFGIGDDLINKIF